MILLLIAGAYFLALFTLLGLCYLGKRADRLQAGECRNPESRNFQDSPVSTGREIEERRKGEQTVS